MSSLFTVGLTRCQCRLGLAESGSSKLLADVDQDGPTTLPTTKVTDETDDLAYRPTDTSTDLNAHSALNNSFRMLDVCLSNSKCCSTTQHRRVGVLDVGCFGFAFDTTAGVNVIVEPERLLSFRLNAPSRAHHSTLA